MTSLDDLIYPRTEFARLARGFQAIEGPIWVRGRLYFHDIPEGKRFVWDEEDGLRLVGAGTNMGNGMDVDAAGRVFACEHTTSAVVSFPSPDSLDGRTVVASHYQGKELNSPNDVVCAPDGSIYFTDPVYGRTNELVGVIRDVQLDFRGVFRVLPDQGDPPDIMLVADGFDGPNGLCFSPDGTFLYVNDTPRQHIRSFRVQPDGSLTDDRVLIDISTATGEGALDGMECDEHGNIWVTGPGGIWVISPHGQKIGVVPLRERALSLVWGGDDLRDLYVTAMSALYRIRTKVRGHRMFDPGAELG